MKTILIIEDDTQIQEIYQKKLTTEGFSVLLASTVQEGLKIIKDNKPDLLILDIMLSGGLNGFDLLEQLRRESVSPDLEIIVLTNLDSEGQTARTLGVREYFVKANTSLETVVEKIKEILKS